MWACQLPAATQPRCNFARADRLVGAISGFYYALLTRRAFQVSTYGELPGFDLVSCGALARGCGSAAECTSHVMNAGLAGVERLHKCELLQVLDPARVDWRYPSYSDDDPFMVWHA